MFGASAPMMFSAMPQAITMMPKVLTPTFCMMPPAGRAVMRQVMPTTDISRLTCVMSVP